MLPFLVTAENDLEEVGKAIVADAKTALNAVEGVIVNDVDPAVTAFTAQFTTDLGKSAMKLSVNFITQAQTDILGAAKALVAAIPAELIADAKDAEQVALNALRVKLTATSTQSAS